MCSWFSRLSRLSARFSPVPCLPQAQRCQGWCHQCQVPLRIWAKSIERASSISQYAAFPDTSSGASFASCPLALWLSRPRPTHSLPGCKPSRSRTSVIGQLLAWGSGHAWRASHRCPECSASDAASPDYRSVAQSHMECDARGAVSPRANDPACMEDSSAASPASTSRNGTARIATNASMAAIGYCCGGGWWRHYKPACQHVVTATSLPHPRSLQQMQQEMHKTLPASLMMQIGVSSGASTRKTSSELEPSSSPASTMAARVLGELCIRVGRKPLQSKSMAKILRASLPVLASSFGKSNGAMRRSVVHICIAGAQDFRHCTFYMPAWCWMSRLRWLPLRGSSTKLSQHKRVC